MSKTFALDIGTRSVIGLLCEHDEDNSTIIDYEIIEHSKRNMYDGQIHDINGVAKIVQNIKTKLEERNNTQISTVSIAAAGRALKTQRCDIFKKLDINLNVKKDDIDDLAIEGIKKAQDLLNESEGVSESRYYCVGYSVVNYYLDNNFIENPEGHKGSELKLDLIATFLPHIVVDGLYTVMNRVGLEVENLTLEPIAAINVAIKKNMRLLNLVLVDIGAGTSDIAITKQGSIIAYGMVPLAGDEITEKLCNEFLLDFDTAEELKVNLFNCGKQKFIDVVGIEHEMDSEDILDRVDESIKHLAGEISDKILEYNTKSPSAVFLIGGGSQIPRLKEYIATNLSLPAERVAIKDSSKIDEIENIPEVLNGPNAITPLGISVISKTSSSKDYLQVTLNDKKLKIYNSKKIKVSDALVMLGYNPRDLIPKSSKDFIYYLNGIKKIIKGNIGEGAKIFVNSKPANLMQIINNGDFIKVEESTIGQKHEPNLTDLISLNEYIKFQNNEINIIKYIKVNGETVYEDIKLKENDKIEVKKIKTLEELLEYMDIDFLDKIFYINDNKTNLDYSIKENDEIIYSIIPKEDEDSKLDTSDKIIDINTSSSNKENTPNKKRESLNRKVASFSSNFSKNLLVTVNEEPLSINHEKEKFILVDIFDHIDFDRTKAKGILDLKINGQRAEFTKELKNGDDIKIGWKSLINFDNNL
ncbi:MAG: rod shape-determining protein [Peptostreptococcaceae bacterium]|nr:rod shape-determining protein [Peptostreptococcaceae bacterium]